VLDAVSTVLQYIDQLHEHLQAAHDLDVTLAGGCNDKINHCYESYMSDDIIAEIKEFKTDSESKKLSHQTCRQGAAKTNCEELCLPDGDCDSYDTYRKAPAPSPALLPACVSQGHLADDFIKADESTEEGKGKLLDMEACLERMNEWLNGFEDETTGTFNDGLYPKYEACNRVKNDCEPGVRACDQEQGDFQASRCLYALESNLRCSAFQACYTEERNACETDCGKIAIRADARAADNETGQRLVCLLHALFGERDPSNSTGTGFFAQPSDEQRPGLLEGCKTQTLQVQDWSIPCPAASSGLPSVTPTIEGFQCPESKVTSPCEDDFYAEMKSEMPWLSVVVQGSDAECSEVARRGMHMTILPCGDAGACVPNHSDQTDVGQAIRERFQVQAGAATITAPFIFEPQFGYVELPDGTQASAAAASAQFSLVCSQETTVKFKAFVLCPNGGANSFRIATQDGVKRDWHFGHGPTFKWGNTSPESTVSAGSSTVTLFGREDGIKFKSLKLVKGWESCHFQQAVQ